MDVVLQALVAVVQLTRTLLTAVQFLLGSLQEIMSSAGQKDGEHMQSS
jgi:hypothetical protein